MTRDINLNDLADEREADIEGQITEQASRAAAVILGIARDDSVKPLITLHLLKQLGDVLEAFDIESASATGQEQALRGQPLAIGAGHSDADNANQALLDELQKVADSLSVGPTKVLEWMKKIFVPLGGLKPEEVEARSAAMINVAMGAVDVKADGSLVIQDDLERLHAQFQPFQAAAAQLARVSDNAEKRKRFAGIDKIASGITQVQDDGTPVAPTPGKAPDAPTIPVEIQNKANMFDDVKAHVHGSKSGLGIFNSTLNWELKFADLTAVTYQALTGEDRPRA